ncbi:hypothetical protein [Streptomyces sp. NPDC004658]|uniref:hypothetical protein n=1 Tax=Streptomyces sp. NPDC004658 TaxID=3154672 RepID=UPI0033BF08C1
MNLINTSSIAETRSLEKFSIYSGTKGTHDAGERPHALSRRELGHHGARACLAGSPCRRGAAERSRPRIGGFLTGFVVAWWQHD